MRNGRVFEKAILSLSCALGLIAVAGCKREINGQVFIVTQGAENIKLGAVEVLLIDKNQVIEFLKIKSEAVAAEISVVEQALYTASNQVQIAQSALNGFESKKPSNPHVDPNEYISNPLFKNYPGLDDIKKRVSVLLQQSQYLLTRSDTVKRQANSIFEDQSTTIALQGYKKSDEAYAEIRKLEDYAEAIERKLKKNVDTAQAELADAKSYLRSFPRVKSYLSDFSPVYVQKIMTDADGRFSFSYPKNKEFTIYATAQRKVINETEYYTWLVDAPKTDDGNFYLSNKNLATVDPNSYFAIKPKR